MPLATLHCIHTPPSLYNHPVKSELTDEITSHHKTECTFIIPDGKLWSRTLIPCLQNNQPALSTHLCFLSPFDPPWNWQGVRRNPAKVRATPLPPGHTREAPIVESQHLIQRHNLGPLGHRQTLTHSNHGLLSQSEVVQETALLPARQRCRAQRCYQCSVSVCSKIYIFLFLVKPIIPVIT